MNTPVWILIMSLLFWVPAWAADDGHDHAAEETGGEADHGGEAEHEEGVLKMSAAEREARGVRVTSAQRRALGGTISAPGEVRINAYRSAQVTPRIAGQIVARHARLGEQVNRNQRLVTLSSVEMAEAQGMLIEADREWQRVEKLGRDVVSDKRYVAAQVARQRAYAAVLAYGMTREQIDRLLQGDAGRATGEFDLLSPQDGTVIGDDFIVGEVVEPGRVLFEVSDESLLWVEAQLRPADAARVSIGLPARVSSNGGRWLDGRIVQIHHRLDRTTRTQGVRIEVKNRDDILHPGEYVEAVVETAAGEARLAVPENAVLLMDGAPAVFKLEGDELHPQPVETGESAAGWVEIQAGLAAGDQVVSEGAFFVKSLLLKSQMGAGHAH